MRYFKIVAFFLITGIFLSPFLVLPKIIRVKKITCSSQFGPCSRVITDSLNSFVDLSLAEAKEKAKDVLSKNVIVSKYLIQYRYPGEIVIDLIETKSLFALKNRQGQVSLIDFNGKAIAKADFTNLPSVTINGDLPHIGEQVNQEMLFALRIIYDMFYIFQTRDGEIIDSSLVVEVNGGRRVIFPLQGDKEVLIGSLNLILSRLNSEDEKSRIEGAEKVTIIDLRFKNPVLK